MQGKTLRRKIRLGGCFTDYTTRIEKSGDELQDAWHDDTVTFENVEITSNHDKRTTDHFLFFDPAHSCNPYLLVEEEVIFFDPGSIPHFPIVMRKVIDTVNPKDISVIVVSHQDPDICGNLAVVEDLIDNFDLKIAAHTNTIRLLRHYGLRSKFYPVEENEFQLTLKSGRVLDFLFTPYLHSPGAIVTYDRKTKSLFSSDIFGAVSKEWALFAKESILEHITVFHQIYMPSREILRNCMKQVEKLNIERILPQHGSVLEGDLIQKAIEHLKDLPCGLDLVMER